MAPGDSTQSESRCADRGSSSQCSGRTESSTSDSPITITSVSFPTSARYAEELSVTVTLRNPGVAEHSSRIELCGLSHGLPTILTQATVYVPGNTTVEHELTAPATPAALSVLCIGSTAYRAPISVFPVRAAIGDQIPLADGTVLRPTAVTHTDDATAVFIDVIEQGHDGPPDRFCFTEHTTDPLASRLGEFTRLCRAWEPLYTTTTTGGWLIFLPQTDKVTLRGEGLQAIIDLET